MQDLETMRKLNSSYTEADRFNEALDLASSDFRYENSGPGKHSWQHSALGEAVQAEQDGLAQAILDSVDDDLAMEGFVDPDRHMPLAGVPAGPSNVWPYDGQTYITDALALMLADGTEVGSIIRYSNGHIATYIEADAFKD